MGRHEHREPSKLMMLGISAVFAAGCVVTEDQGAFVDVVEGLVATLMTYRVLRWSVNALRS